MVKIGVSFYYVGDLQQATHIYSNLLGTTPFILDEDWVRFHLEGGDIALHLDPDIQIMPNPEPMKYGAVVSLSVDQIHQFLKDASKHGFTVVGEVQDLPYGFMAELRDPWANRLSIIEPKER